MIRLGVNIDHVATVRQARRTYEPDPVAAAILATLAGADGITIHLREDRRHIQDDDVRRVREAIHTRLNLEMACWDEIVAMAVALKPDEATLVPEKREELTTEGGLDVAGQGETVGRVSRRLSDAGIVVAHFIDPDFVQVHAARKHGAAAVEFHTGTYADARGESQDVELQKLASAAGLAIELGLRVHMGHGLNYHNIAPIVRIPGVEELNIGHSIVSRAVLVGMERAVADMKRAIADGQR